MFATIVIDLDPNLFQIGPFLITWHGVFSVLGILAAARVAQILLKPEGISADRVYDLAVWMVIAGLIGARLLYVWENYRQFAGAWQRIVYINEGGLSQWGGIFGGLIGAFLWCWQNKVDYRLFLDAAGPANALGFAIGPNLPFAVQYVNEKTLGEPGRAVHLEVGYELIFNAIVFGTSILTYRWFKRRLPVGVTGLIWLSVYAIGRFVLSFLRKDSLVLGLRQAQWASLAMLAVSLVAIAIWMLRTGRTAPEEPAKQQEAEEQEATA